MIEDDTHDKLTKAYLEYYKANEAWEIRKSERTKRSARKWLSEIRRLCSTRRVEIIDEYKAKKDITDTDTE
jgi:hypothetical protein|tara:strand:- start:27 stop:239 length:213 start_codon:yes stop_codon:yes gene_type:complete